MAITLVDDPGGLFDCLGKIGKWLEDADTYAGTTIPALAADIITQFNWAAGGQPQISDVLPNAASGNQNAVVGVLPTLQQMASQLVVELVRLDAPQPNSSLTTALKELIRQMKDGSQTVKACTVTATSAPVAGNTGDGVMVAFTKRGDGLEQENIFAEVAKVECIGDGYTGGSVAGNERFMVSGLEATNSIFHWDWPKGSGTVAQLIAVDGSRSGSANLLTNSSFELFTVANTPDNWTIVTGAAGTEVFEQAAGYDGKCVDFAGGTGLNTAITQTFALNLAPLTTYIANLWIKASVVPASGVLTVDLVDGTDTVINDALGQPCAATINLAGVTTAFVNRGLAFTTPELLPTPLKIRVWASTAIPAGTTISIDRLALTLPVPIYQGGPYAAIFSGSTRFLLDDAFTFTTTNDRAGAGNANFQTLFDRLFSMRQLGLLLPSAPSGETIPASLIG